MFGKLKDKLKNWAKSISKDKEEDKLELPSEEELKGKKIKEPKEKVKEVKKEEPTKEIELPTKFNVAEQKAPDGVPQSTEFGGKYNLQLDEVAERIKKQKAKLVLLQFPDGLKPYATAVVDYLESQIPTSTELLIWLGDCFGACDMPEGLPKNVDLVIQFGHSDLMPKI